MSIIGLRGTFEIPDVRKTASKFYVEPSILFFPPRGPIISGRATATFNFQQAPFALMKIFVAVKRSDDKDVSFNIECVPTERFGSYNIRLSSSVGYDVCNMDFKFNDESDNSLPLEGRPFALALYFSLEIRTHAITKEMEDMCLNSVCSICLENRASVVSDNCTGHAAMCSVCVERILTSLDPRCPLCRNTIDVVKKYVGDNEAEDTDRYAKVEDKKKKP